MSPEILKDTCESGHEVTVTIDDEGNVRFSGGLTDETRADHLISPCDACRAKGELLARR